MSDRPQTSILRRLAIGFSPRIRMVLAIGAVGVISFFALGLSSDDLSPTQAGWNKCKEFFAASVSPAFDYENVPPIGTESLLIKVGRSMIQTVAYAACAISLAIIAGLVLGFLCSSAWWQENNSMFAAKPQSHLASVLRLTAMWFCRCLVVFLRSIHELIWAVLFLCAFGLNNATAILAIAIPYSGVFAKVFSEMIDEAPRDSAIALRTAGASGPAVFLVGLLPRALADMLAYACYRFECAVRSCAVMGFFGIPTLGYHLRPAFQEQHYHEVWTYLYALVLLIVAIDIWSGQLRRRLVQ